MFDIDDLTLFVKVSELGGLTRAAEALGRPKSSASRQLARLEGQVGAPLFERTRNAMRLTDKGELLKQHARSVIEALDNAAAAMTALNGEPTGVLKINAPHLFATQIIAPHSRRFLARYPEIDLVIDTAPKPIGEVGTDVDVSIRVGPVEDTALIGRKIGVSELRLFASPAMFGRESQATFERDLADSDLIAGERLTYFRQVIDRKRGKLEVVMNVWEPATRHAFVIAGVGASWLPAFLCRSDVDAGRLVPLLPERRFGPIDILAVFSVQSGATAKVRAFIDFLIELDFAPVSTTTRG